MFCQTETELPTLGHIDSSFILIPPPPPPPLFTHTHTHIRHVCVFYSGQCSWIPAQNHTASECCVCVRVRVWSENSEDSLDIVHHRSVCSAPGRDRRRRRISSAAHLQPVVEMDFFPPSFLSAVTFFLAIFLAGYSKRCVTILGL